jgi:gliding motility-associated-like protein
MNGCSDNDTTLITVNPLPEITAFSQDNLILQGTSTQLIATGAGPGGQYDWNPPIGLDDPTLAGPVATLVEPTTYIVTGKNANGCLDTASVNIDVGKTVVFPDGITPNGDGLNETWVIRLIDEFPNAKVMIFNRWGQKVFESEGYSDEWDGTRNGKKLPVGTYYYVIDLGPGNDQFSGPVTLMR